ncbi:hypothetical protein [Sediminibacterium sp.]|jgi:hypothetical protein|uniref:hypothetical protein n=1 Tax=Sediminibacterium sp. TaxID=1917865 RepID=UPI0025EA3DC3|nr:hypothetical protein [Sediminibacterium sp.]MBW0177939.1 hypothetical protein [Sediminibacterium sp.]
MIRTLFTIFIVFIISASLKAQDTAVLVDNQAFTLSEVVVRNNFDYKRLLSQIKEDTTFYKAFRNLRILGFTSYNDIKMLDKKGAVKASLYSKTRQNRADGCRTMDVLEEKITGDFYDSKKEFNYTTPELYAGLFFTTGKVCGEDNIVKGRVRTTSNKKGMEKHKEQLKMLFFNPGKKIPGIPFIGNKLDLYDDDAHKLYDYRLDLEEYKGQLCYVFSITPKENLGFFKSDRVVVDQMTTWFDQKTLEVMGRNYSLSYKAGVYDFDVSMEVEMGKFEGLTVPKTLRYKGNWDAMFKKRERAIFTATLFDFKK